jgi:uncharacterized protein YehS (DUF1456 family)
MTEKQHKEFEIAARPLMDWLKKNCNPHVTALATSEYTELLEGMVTAHRDKEGWATISENTL